MRVVLRKTNQNKEQIFQFIKINISIITKDETESTTRVTNFLHRMKYRIKLNSQGQNHGSADLIGPVVELNDY